MKRSSFTLLFSLFALLTFSQYNNTQQSDKDVLREKVKPPKWGSYLNIVGGGSVSDPSVALGVEYAVSHRYLEVGVTALQELGKPMRLSLQAGYRFTPWPDFTAVMKVGTWNAPNDVYSCYTLQFIHRTEGNLQFFCQGTDYRYKTGAGNKILTVGLQCVLTSKKYRDGTK